MGSDPTYLLTELGEQLGFFGIELGLRQDAFADQAMQFFESGADVVNVCAATRAATTTSSAISASSANTTG